MRACLFYGPEDLRYEEISEETLRPGEVRVNIKSALTGGTDLKSYLRGHPKLLKNTPSKFGYEFCGEISELADDIQNWQIGDKVVCGNTVPCFNCYFCEKEEYSLCQNLEFLNGSFAESIIIPAKIVAHNLYKVPDSVPEHIAASTQTLAVALHGFEKSQIKAGSTIGIYGLGAIGQTFIKICRALVPQAKIIAFGRSEWKRKLAEENGADLVIDISKEKSREEILEIIKDAPFGLDYVIEAVGKTDAWQKVLELVRPGGLVNFFGGCPKGSLLELDTYKMHYEELRLIGVFHHSPKYIKKALDLISDGSIQMENLITHEKKLSELEDALKLQLEGKAMKVHISCI